MRQPLSPGAVRALAGALADPAVGCATGNLVLAGGAGSGVYWRYENWIRRQESSFRGVVGMTGPIAMVRRADLRRCPTDLILDDVWIPMRLALAGKRTVFVAEAAGPRQRLRGRARVRAQGAHAGRQLPAVRAAAGAADPVRNPIWFETVSHKIMRLAAPWLLVVLALLSIAGSGTWMNLLLAGQAAFYLAAAIGKRAGKLGALGRTFVVLNAAAVLGLWRYLGGRQRVTW